MPKADAGRRDTGVSPTSPLDGIRTPDNRYIVVRGRLWRAVNPNLPQEDKTRWTRSLMSARRAVAAAKRADDVIAVAQARRQVDRAKRALGERGPGWWDDGAPDQNRRMVWNTGYAAGYERAETIADAILALLDRRPKGASICPSEAARHVDAVAWRSHLNEVRDVARHLARRALIEIRQRNRRIEPDAVSRGPIRLALPAADGG